MPVWSGGSAGNLGATLPKQRVCSQPHQPTRQVIRGQRPAMKYFDEAAPRRANGAQQNWLTALLAALGLAVVALEPAAAQTAFTLPAPPVDLPVLPSLSGNWTATVGIGGEYRPDFQGSKNWMLIPIPIIAVRRAGSV